MSYLRDAMMEQKMERVSRANADLDCNRKAFFELLCRPSLDKRYAAFLIANVHVDASEELLRRDKKDLLSRARRFIDESEVEKRSPIEWLRWAVDHNELLLEMEKDKDRITQVLLAFEIQQEKPLHPSERRSAGQIIAALAAIAKLDLSAPYSAEVVLRNGAATHLLELPSSPETVVKFLKDAAARTSKV